MNLLENAVKYTESGKVIFKVEMIAGKHRFSVADTGIGIAQEHLSDIFTSFHQLHKTHSYVEGTGLGLAISEQLVRLLGGQLQVNSQIGAGSKFWFDLKLPPSKQADITETILSDDQIITAMKGNRQKILITDDETDNRNLLVDMLSPFDFELHEAINGQDCIEQTLTWKPDLILMDSKMPVMDGLDACRYIRSTKEIKQIKIIAISANVYGHHRLLCLEAGADDFLSKPLQLQQMLEMIARHTGLEPVYEIRKPGTLSKINGGDKGYSYPPNIDLERLLVSAEQGDIQEIRKQLDELKQSDSSYLIFLEQMHSLTNDFQINKICQLLNLAINKADKNI
jgi:CheY-like chemotaxis protein